MSKGDKQETTTTQAFPAFLQAPIERAIAGAEETIPAVPELSPQVAGLLSNLLSGQTNPLVQEQLDQTLRGDFLTGPAVDRLFGAASDRATAEINRRLGGTLSPFIAAGRGRSGLSDVAIAQTVSDAVSGNIATGVLPFLSGERGRQVGAATSAQNLDLQRALGGLGFGFREAEFATLPATQRLGLLSALLQAPTNVSQTQTSRPGALSLIGAGIGAFGSLTGFGGPFGAGGAFAT